jgi:uracil-DNA glycosylase
MLSRPLHCRSCPADLHVRGWMEVEGTGANGVMAIGESLGDREVDAGSPFQERGAAGYILRSTMKKAGLDPSQFSINNVCRCQPPQNKLEHQPWEFGAIQHCKTYMDAEVERFRPRVLLALGGVALRTLTSYFGQKRSITNVRGFYLDGTRYNLPVISTYHPAFIARDKQNLLGVLKLDILRAVNLAKVDGRFLRPERRFLKFPGIEAAETWLRVARLHPELPINFDIETTDSILGVDESELKVLSDGAVEIAPIDPEYVEAREEDRPAVPTEYESMQKQIIRNSRITQIQFSIWGDGDAIVVPWDGGPFTEFAKQVMRLPNEKHGWNSFAFDQPILAQHDCTVAGRHIDLMWAWHHLQPDLPRGLQYATSFYIPEAEPWKHRAGEDAGEYGGFDVSLPRQFGPRLLDNLRQRGLWTGFDRHVLQLWPILSVAASRGIPVDNDKRIALGEKVDGLRRGVDVELQGVFPDELRNCEPKNGYMRTPDALLTECPSCGGAKKLLNRPVDLGVCDVCDWDKDLPKKFHGLDCPQRNGPKKINCPICAGKGKVEDAEKARVAPGEGERWVKRTFIGSKALPSDIQADSEGPSEFSIPSNTNVEPVSNYAGSVARWCRLQPFLPNSSKQILAYIRWKREAEVQEKIAGYKGNAGFAAMSEDELRAMAERNALYYVPKKFREDKDTTAKKELERLGAKTKDPFFAKVIEHREYGKIKSTYVEGWAPAADGRVHTTFSFGPATGQLSGSGPNTMNAPLPGGESTPAEKRKTDLAHWFRDIIVAPTGYRLWEVDKRAFHATTLGFNAKDPAYMRIAAMDIHSFVTANVLWASDRQLILNAKLPPNPESWLARPDEELAELLGIVKKNWKAIRDKKAKPTILGIGLGLGDAKCFEMNKKEEINPNGFVSLAEVKQFKDVLRGLFPSIFRFHNSVRQLAHAQGFLKSRHGFIRWFFDVFHKKFYQGQWVDEPGRDSEAAIAFFVQNDAHGMLKEEMLALEEMGAMEKFQFINPIHDSLNFCSPAGLVEEGLHTVCGVMNAPSRVLVDSAVAPQGLVCRVEAKVSNSSWDKMEVVEVK